MLAQAIVKGAGTTDFFGTAYGDHEGKFDGFKFGDANVQFDDTLLLIESLPAQETRNYVEKVVAGYWTYRTLFGAPSNTLDALATGSRTVDIRLDAKAVGPVLAAASGA